MDEAMDDPQWVWKYRRAKRRVEATEPVAPPDPDDVEGRFRAVEAIADVWALALASEKLPDEAAKFRRLGAMVGDARREVLKHHLDGELLGHVLESLTTKHDELLEDLAAREARQDPGPSA